MRDVQNLLLVDLHPRPEKLLERVDLHRDVAETVDDLMAEITFLMSFDRRGIVAFVEREIFEVSLTIHGMVGFCDIKVPILSLTHIVLNKITKIADNLQLPSIFIQPYTFTFPSMLRLFLDRSQVYKQVPSFVAYLRENIITALLIMKNIYTLLGHFLIGLTDSLSPSWITGVLLYTDPQTGKILPQSIKLQRVLGRSLLQAGLITTVLPILLKYFGLFYVGWLVMGLSLIFTYGYLVFYNMDVTRQAMQIIIWKTKKNKQSMPELDVRQKIDPITDISNQIQSFIFEMVYYTPVNLLLIVITLFDEKYFPWIMTIMDCFFNTAFYYFRKWPYDKYNVAFLEAHMSYSMGYGAFVSVVTNIWLPTSMSIGGYLLISQWMIINALCHSPPQVEFNSFRQVWAVLTKREQRRKLPSAYNIHRKKMRTDIQYRKQIMKNCYYMKSFFVLTARINTYLQKHLFKNNVPQTEVEFKSEPSAATTTASASHELPSIIQLSTENEVNTSTVIMVENSQNPQHVSQVASKQN